MRLGVKGWLWPAWETDFYPQDMPTEWRLAYYNTQFDCVYLEAAAWRDRSQAELAEWAGDCQDGFLFLLEGEDSELPESLRGKARMLRAEAAELVWFERGTDLKTLATELQARNPGSTCLVSRDADLGQIERVRIVLQLLGY